jgi:hypothetical protein
LFNELDIPIFKRDGTVIDLVFAREGARYCEFLKSEDVGSDYFLQLWSLDVTGSARGGRVEPRCEFNICRGGFNFKNAD